MCKPSVLFYDYQLSGIVKIPEVTPSMEVYVVAFAFLGKFFRRSFVFPVIMISL